jgi:aspartate carbamoyltransferase catalytic subunit
MTAASPKLRARHLLAISDLNRPEIDSLLDLAENYLDLSVQKDRNNDVLAGKTLIN